MKAFADKGLLDDEMRKWIYDQAKALCSEGQPAAAVLDFIRAQFLLRNAFADYEQHLPEIKSVVDAALIDRKRDQANARRAALRALQEGRDASEIPAGEVVSLEDALLRFVFAEIGQQVVDTETNRVLTRAEFADAFAASRERRIDPETGRLKTIPMARVWLEHPSRKTTSTTTYRPSAGRLTVNPEGVPAINLWAEPTHRPPENWTQLATIFTAHVDWLWGDDSQPFLDWLAHIEQRPGELPHFGWLHVARNHGLGRNWLAAVLTRVWTGHVAASFDLLGTLSSGFNGALSRCHLAIVDEIYEGGGLQWRHESALRQLITADRRHINPKFGRQSVEYNCARWLLLSNHTGALPFDQNDRRFWVVSHQGQPRSAAYYENLYGQLREPALIAAVREFLRQRDIARFNPGQRPPLNSAKLEMIDMARSEADRMASDVARRWPVDVIFLSEFRVLMDVDHALAFKPAAIAHALDRAGITKWPRSSGKLRVTTERLGRFGQPAPHHEVAYVIRRHEHWSVADAESIRREQARLLRAEKEAALFAEADSAPPRVPVPACSRLFS